MKSYALPLTGHLVRFGHPVESALAEELEKLHSAQPLLVTTRGGASRLDAVFSDVSQPVPYTSRFTKVIAHVPENVVDDAVAVARESNADALIAFGGGSALDTAKAVSNRINLPIIAIPTNFSGSEVTFNFGLTISGFKQTVINPDVMARAVIYDPRLFDTLPSEEAKCGGINAIAHAVEALYGKNSNPLTSALAVEAITLMVNGLRRQHAGSMDGVDENCIQGAWLCGEVLAHVGMALHHRMCHVLGGTFGLTHAHAHTVMLPYSVDFNEDSTQALAPLVPLYGGGRLGAGMQRFGRDIGVPGNLEQLGFSRADIDEAATLVVSTPLHNPREVEYKDVKGILTRAWAGEPLSESVAAA